MQELKRQQLNVFEFASRYTSLENIKYGRQQ